MHGLGNDYIYLNCIEEPIEAPEKLAPIISDRHFGVGSDGLILIEASEKADVRMRIFNADGSEAEMCGNGIRCVAKFTYENKLVQAGDTFSIPGQQPCTASLNIETGNGILTVGLILNESDSVHMVCVNMGQPVLVPERIPLNLSGEEVVDVPIEISNQKLLMTCVSMGNPHAVFFCEDVNQIELNKIGPMIENHSLFPNRINVHFVQTQNTEELRIRTWERGSGITLACGTGACACCVAGVITGRCERITTIHLPGGDLKINWSEQDNCVYMTGPAVKVFEGIWHSDEIST
jgi:diaminopimelate epimerase